jgi:hypothetical protein
MSGGIEQLQETVEDATSVLLSAPAESDFDDDACIDLLTRTEPSSTNVLSVTASKSPGERLALWNREVPGRLPKRLAVVDASGTARTATAAVADRPPSVTVDVLASDAEPVDVGMAVARRLGAWESSEESTALCLHSLTSLFDWFDCDDVISLVSGLNRLCDAVDVTGHHHVDPTMTDEETLTRLWPLYDAVIEHVPGDGWTVSRAPADADAPSFRRSTDPPGGTAGSRSGPPETIPVPYSFDQMLDLISTPRRRSLLYHLKDRDGGRIPVEDLVGAVVRRERSIPAREAPASEDDVRVSLIHTHLPKLAELGLVEFELGEPAVEYHANPALESFLRYIETLELG